MIIRIFLICFKCQSILIKYIFLTMNVIEGGSGKKENKKVKQETQQVSQGSLASFLLSRPPIFGFHNAI